MRSPAAAREAELAGSSGGCLTRPGSGEGAGLELDEEEPLELDEEEALERDVEEAEAALVAVADCTWSGSA